MVTPPGVRVLLTLQKVKQGIVMVNGCYMGGLSLIKPAPGCNPLRFLQGLIDHRITAAPLLVGLKQGYHKKGGGGGGGGTVVV